MLIISCCTVAQSSQTFCDPHGACQAPLSLEQTRPKLTNILKISARQEMAGRTQPPLPFSAKRILSRVKMRLWEGLWEE